jgi:hypothetical protein
MECRDSSIRSPRRAYCQACRDVGYWTPRHGRSVDVYPTTLVHVEKRLERQGALGDDKCRAPRTCVARLQLPSDIRTLVCQQYREPIAAAMATTTTAHPAPAMSSTDSDRIDKEPRLTHTSTNISLSPELFEKLYLAPKTPNANDHVGRYANATPLGFLG